MALDVGDARIGVAVSDPLRMFAQPLTTITRKKDQNTAAEIAALMVEQKVSVLVVGLPSELSGSRGEQAAKVEAFIEKLRRAIGKTALNARIEFWDERLTTVQAQRVIAGSKLKNRERDAALDRVSAAIILEGYLAWVEQQGPSNPRADYPLEPDDSGE